MSQTLTPHGRLPQPGFHRVGPMLPVQDILREAGLDPAAILAQADFPESYLSDPENQVPVSASLRLLAVCAVRMNCPHFALLIGMRGGLASLGRLGFLVQNEASVGAAMDTLIGRMHRANRVLIPIQVKDGDAVTLNLLPYNGPVAGVALMHDLVVAMAFRILRELCGSAWQPLEVQISHTPPADMAPYSNLFRCPVRFNAEVSSITFPDRWLAQPIAGANPTLRLILAGDLGLDTKADADVTADDVRRIMRVMIPNGEVSADTIARQLGLHPRTMHRRLAGAGHTFRSLVADVRLELASHVIRNTDTPLSQVATMVGYADATAFSRAFRRWTGRTPKEWRDVAP